MRMSLRSQSGFTLIELLLYVSIVGSLLMAIGFFLALSTDSRIKNQSANEVNQQGTAAMELITQTIRNADSITSPAAAATAASLNVSVPTASLSPTVFSLSGTALQIKEGTAAAVPITNSDVQISSLTFKNLSRASTPGTVQVSFIVSRTNPGNRNEYDYQRTFTTTASIRQ